MQTLDAGGAVKSVTDTLQNGIPFSVSIDTASAVKLSVIVVVTVIACAVLVFAVKKWFF